MSNKITNIDERSQSLDNSSTEKTRENLSSTCVAYRSKISFNHGDYLENNRVPKNSSRFMTFKEEYEMQDFGLVHPSQQSNRSMGSGKSLAEVNLHSSERNLHRKISDEEREIYYQRHHPKESADDNYEKKRTRISKGLENTSKEQIMEKDKQDKATECSSDDDSLDFLFPTIVSMYRKQRRLLTITFICLTLFLCAAFFSIFILSNGKQNNAKFRGTITSHGNVTIPSSSITEYSLQEDILLNSSHGIVKACIEGRDDSPETCQEYCEPIKCCFDELNCETTLTEDQCIIYAACYTWVMDTYNVSATESNGR